MAQGVVMPSPKFVGLADDGTPLVGGFLNVYEAGTLVRADTFSDSDLSVPNDNPIELDAGGRATVYLEEATYKFVLTDSLGNEIWSQDNIASTQLGQGAGIGEIFSLGGTSLSPITAVAYSPGTDSEDLLVDSGQWLIDSENLPGTYALEVMLKSGDGIITVTAALVNLSDGAPDTPLVTCASASAVGIRVRSDDIVFAAAGAAKLYGVKAKVSGAAPGGYAWAARIVRIA